MKEEPKKQNPWTDPELEARIVALVLGEASDFEREELNRLIEEWPDLAAFKEQIQGVHGLLRDATTGESVAEDDEWKLPAEKRSAVLAAISGETKEQSAEQVVTKAASEGRRPVRRSLFWRLATIAAVLCIVVITGSLGVPRLFNSASPEFAPVRQLASKEEDTPDSIDASEHFLGENSGLGGKPIESDSGTIVAPGEERFRTTEPATDAEVDYKKNSASALSAIRGTLDADGVLPSPYYLKDDVQYFSTGREFKLPPEVDTPREGRARENQVRVPTAGVNGPGPGLSRQAFDNLAMTGEGGAEGSERYYGEPTVQGASSGDLSFPKLAEGLGDPDVSDPTWSIPSGESTASSSGRRYDSDADEERLATRVYPVGDLVMPVQPPVGGMGMGGGGARSGSQDSPPDALSEPKDLDADKLANSQDAGAGAAPAADGGLLEEFADEGKFLNSIRNTEEVLSQKIQADVKEQLGDARDRMGTNPEGAQRELKLLKETVQQSTDLDPETRAQMRDQVESAIRESGRQIHEFEARRLLAEQNRAAAEDRQKLLEEMDLSREKTKQMMDRFNALMDEGRYRNAEGTIAERGEQKGKSSGPQSTDKQNESLRQRLAVAGKSHWYGYVPPMAEDEWGAMRKAPMKRFAAPTGLNEKTADDDAFSTFSLHVSDVSFKLARAALARGEWPEAAKVRIEEFINAFDYGDPMPSRSEKVSCQLEQSIHPFLQQRNLLRISMRTAAAGRSSNTPLRLTFVLDNSGSMERIDRRQTVRRAFALLVRQLKPIDQVTLISFARQPRLLADKVSGDKSRKLVQLIADLPSEGGTNIEAALQLAFEKAKEQQVDGAENRIVLLTDGAVNLGDADPESLSQMITTMRGAGIAFDAAGICAEGLNDEVLEALTRKGDGRYYLLDSLEAADDGFARQIAGALRPSARNVKAQVEFNPKRVGRYKLLGFEKHRLKQEDFRNDSVDAAEMAAAEAGVAMYQLEAKPDGEGDVGSVSVRFRDLSTGQMVENRWPIPYEAAAPRPDQAAPSLRIATSAALLAAKLRGEVLGETVDLKTLSDLIAGLPDQDRDADRVRQLHQMIQQARQLSGE